MEIRQIVIDLKQVKETKNMIRYDAPGDEEQQSRANVPNLYVRKTALATAFGKFPAVIKVTIESTDAIDLVAPSK